LWEKLFGILYYDGPAGIARAGMRSIMRLLGGEQTLAQLVAARCPGVTHLCCDDLHEAESLALLRGLAPDLGVMFASYPLNSEVFTIPRLGCLNLHLGCSPRFGGTSPAFYEMLESEPTVGVTIHRVTHALDAGSIVAQESFPLDLAPAGDPLVFLQRYQAEVLIPNGVRLMAEAVRRFARGEVNTGLQLVGAAPVRKRATYRLKRELRRRVARRRERKAGLIFA
jgi:folate-dependent phosphoribosylglycinamide formyltransferase PurN